MAARGSSPPLAARPLAVSPPRAHPLNCHELCTSSLEPPKRRTITLASSFVASLPSRLLGLLPWPTTRSNEGTAAAPARTATSGAPCCIIVSFPQYHTGTLPQQPPICDFSAVPQDWRGRERDALLCSTGTSRESPLHDRLEAVLMCWAFGCRSSSDETTSRPANEPFLRS